jgi:DNA polymerase III epsilon subunit family exonuclease
MPASYDPPATPLHDVTFCVVDLETTGTSASSDAITEVGAVKFRGGECLGTFQTLVEPGRSVSPGAARLTGIDDDLVAGAPGLGGVLAAFQEFVGGAVLVGHNLRFDVSFLSAALATAERAGIALVQVDTVALARRLLGDEVPDCRLATLARHLHLPCRPTHRALTDALATADLLHVLIERAAGLGVETLEDLVELPQVARHPLAAKLALTSRLPRAPGVYLLRDARGEPLHVGWARDLRRRVRSFFARPAPGDGRRGVAGVLRAVHRIDHLVCASALEAAVARVRLAQALEPRHDRRLTRWRSYRYVRIADGTGHLSTPRVVRDARADGATYLGPLASTADARAVVAALSQPDAAMPAAPLAGASAPVGGEALWAALRRQGRFDALRGAHLISLRLPDGTPVELARGRLVVPSAGPSPGCGDSGGALDAIARTGGPGPAPDDGPLPRELADEYDVVGSWLERGAGGARLVHVDGVFATAVPWLAGPTTAAASAPLGRAPPLRSAIA